MFGVFPFGISKIKAGSDIGLYQQQLNMKKLIFPDRKKFNVVYSDQFKDFLKKLLNKDKDERLGAGKDDYLELRNHQWF